MCQLRVRGRPVLHRGALAGFCGCGLIRERSRQRITERIRGKFTVSRVEINQGSQRIRTPDGNDYEKDEHGYIKTKPCELRTVVLNPVHANSDRKHENTRFWDYSPSGEIKLGTVNPDAWNCFQIGKEYYMDFTEAPQKWRGMAPKR